MAAACAACWYPSAALPRLTQPPTGEAIANSLVGADPAGLGSCTGLSVTALTVGQQIVTPPSATPHRGKIMSFILPLASHRYHDEMLLLSGQRALYCSTTEAGTRPRAETSIPLSAAQVRISVDSLVFAAPVRRFDPAARRPAAR